MGYFWKGDTMENVTQEDREAAAEIFEHQGRQEMADLVRASVRDSNKVVQVLAAHRRASVAALEAENARLRELVKGWHYLAVGPDEMGDYYTHKQLVKLSEPYASPALASLAGKEEA
jgi:hypothetical protein